MSYHQRVYNRLRELENGAAPVKKTTGICYDIFRSVPGVGGADGAYQYCEDLFTALGLDPHRPLDDEDYTGKWQGERGKQRRALCKRMADYIQQNLLENNEPVDKQAVAQL